MNCYADYHYFNLEATIVDIIVKCRIFYVVFFIQKNIKNELVSGTKTDYMNSVQPIKIYVLANALPPLSGKTLG